MSRLGESPAALSSGAKAFPSALVCPICHGDLEWEAEDAHCMRCAERYPIVEGIPHLAARASGSDPHKRKQAVSHDVHETPDFEIARPLGTPSFYGALMLDKYRRGISRVLPLLCGATVVDVCAGSGMDAEFLARSGAQVICADISHGAALRAKERATRADLPIFPLVADCEALPLGEDAVDIAYVHDGLHHLEDPYAGLREMVRTASLAVSINEPADALLTQIAVLTGLSLNVEESGNRVARLRLDNLVERLSDAGFQVLQAERYGMFYRHHPGPVVHALSRRRVRRAAEVALRAANRIAGGMGNKLAVQAAVPSARDRCGVRVADVSRSGAANA